jgi:hypothetical protein
VDVEQGVIYCQNSDRFNACVPEAAVRRKIACATLLRLYFS